MGVVPVVFRKSPDSVIQSYNYTDLASGTGYVDYYAAECVSGACLTNITYYSEMLCSTGNSTSATYEKVIDKDFDVLINSPMTLKGKAIINISYRVESAGGASSPIGYPKARIRKYSNGVETELVEATGTAVSSGGGTVYRITALDLIVPQTQFKKGDYLRLTIEGWLRRDAGAGSVTLTIAHDPKGRTADAIFSWDTTGAYPTPLKFQAPIRVVL